jgi:uncharacterized peroxidase-related enzyme
MSNLAVNYNAAPKTTELLSTFQQKVGTIPNIYRLIGHSPNTLEGFMNFNAALSKGTLSAQEREQIALTVAGFNKCEYCASAHTQIAKKHGIADSEASSNLRGKSSTAKTQALLTFATRVLETRGNVGTGDVEACRKSGYSDEQIVEIVANIAANVFTNYFNGVARTELDFPRVAVE